MVDKDEIDMERTVPTAESEEIELYQRTYYSLLRSTAEVKIRTLEEVHAGMNSLLHPDARQSKADMSAFIYSILRLPVCMPFVRLVVLGQSADVFKRAGFPDVCEWQEVYAVARRRRCFYNGDGVLACFIASRSDIDDVIPLLTAYQIEWNKLHLRFERTKYNRTFEELRRNVNGHLELADILQVPQEDFDRLYAIWRDDFFDNIEGIAAAPLNLRVRLLSGSLNEYRRARHAWWENIEEYAPDVRERPVYFVSSNTHSMVNVLGGFARDSQAELITYLEETAQTGLLNEWRDIQLGESLSSADNFLYYVFRKYSQSPKGRHTIDKQLEKEQNLGITRVPSTFSFDVEAQIFDLSRLKWDHLDPRLCDHDLASALRKSDALILNIDYPLGLAAYDILTEVASNSGDILGVYVMGKAATLNAVVGDVMISNVVHDEHSLNTYLFPNCFSASDIAPDLIHGTVLDNQKSMTVQGTFLQNADYMDVFYREGYTDIEMEAGPYLSAVYELHRPKRHPSNEIVNLYGLPFDMAIVHYASDTPLSKGKNLGAGSLSYHGMDATYAVSLAILRRIFQIEDRRLQRR